MRGGAMHTNHVVIDMMEKQALVYMHCYLHVYAWYMLYV